MKARINSWIVSFVLIISSFNSLQAQPGWTINSSDYQYTCSITGTISINGAMVGSENSMIGAFVGNECRGVVKTRFVAGTDRWVVFLTVYSNQVMGEEVSFKYYNQPIDFIHEIDNQVGFVVNMSLGSLDNLYEFIANAAEDNKRLSITPGYENIILKLTSSRLTVAGGSTSAQLDAAITPPKDDAGNVVGTYVIRYHSTGVPVAIDGATVVTEDMEVMVTAQDGSTRVYEIFIGNNDASLAGITVSAGSLDPAFTATHLYYDVYLPFGSEVPQVTGVVTDPLASLNLIQADAVPGTAYLVVTAEDGVTVQTYRVYYYYLANVDASLSLLEVEDYQLDPVFNTAVTNYLVRMTYGTTVMPNITYTTTDVVASGLVTAPAALPGLWSVVVTAEDGVTQLTYSIDFQWLPNENALLETLSVTGYELDPVFDPQLTNYVVLVPAGTTSVPAVKATPQDDQASLEFFPPDEIPGTYEVEVTAMDGLTKSSYYIVFGWAGNTDATLSDLQLYGETLSGFNTATKTYHFKIPEGEIRYPEIMATATDPNARVEITQAGQIPGMAMVVVFAENFSIFSTYWVGIEYSPWDACLCDLQLDGLTIEGFHPDVFSYEIELPSGTLFPPTISASVNNPEAGMVTVQADNPEGEGKVSVFSADATVTREYVISFSVATGSRIDDFGPTDVSVYPNPIIGTGFRVQLGAKQTSQLTGSVQIRLLNSLGFETIIKQVQGWDANSLYLNTQGLPSGTYFLEIIIGKKRTIKPIIIAR